jgi:phospholipid transport system substrate-binding protein
MREEGRRMRAVVAAVVALGLVLGPWLAAPARAGAPLDQLRAQIDRVLKVLDDPDMKKETRGRDRRLAVRKIADDIFDFQETAKRSLARHWLIRTAAERDEFVRLFSDLLERSYISKIELYGGEKIAYLGDVLDGDQAMVRTRIVTKGGAEVPIEYRMLKKAERWLVYDVNIEGVSLVANYRTQFNKIIQTSSYAELVKKMKVKQDEFIETTKKS